jgi:hypothetical protein
MFHFIYSVLVQQFGNFSVYMINICNSAFCFQITNVNLFTRWSFQEAFSNVYSCANTNFLRVMR